ncbi:hypothetical protein HAZT_HAZT001677 [Hyalella azteca]|nr:hypothetical protein HAZT_HAZT001677 [Hyalella azteca]
MQKLTDALARVNQEKKDLEVRLRSQLCSEFSKQMIEVENNWRQRLDDQKARSDEHHDWQIARLTEFYSSGAQPCKRARPDDTIASNSSALEDSILQFRQSRMEELESQLNDVQEKLASRDAQVETLTATLKKSSEGGRKAQEEITKLQFQLATLTNSYDQLQRKLEHSEKIAESAVPETEALLGLQKQVAELEDAQQQLNADLHDSREMLVEAANAYALKEEEVSSLSCEVVSLRQALAEQANLLEQAQEELSGAQELASERTRALEERESAVEDMQLQLSNTREIVRQLRQKLKASEERIAELAAEKQEAENALVRDKSKLLVEMAEMKNQLTDYVASPGLPKKVLQLQKANKDFQDQLCANQLELKRLQGENQSATEKILELEKDFCNIHSELKERDSQLADKNKILDETVRSLQEKEEIISDLQIKIGANINETKRLGHLINEKEEKINVLLSQLQEANGELARLTEKGPTGENEVAARELSGHELRARLDAAIERAAEASRQLDVMREKYEDLETSAGASNEQMVASFRRYEEKCLELDAIKRQFTGHPIDISNKDSALIDARTKISQLEALLQEKSEKLLRMENIKNENKRLSSSQKSGVFQQESTRESHLSNILERLEEELENSEAKCENLTQVNRSLLKENLEYEQKHATEREKLLKQLEEAKKVHISATRYKDCELASAKKESEDARHQAAKLREENAAVEKELAMQAAELESLSSKHDSLVTKQQNLEQEYNSLLTERDSLVTERDRLVTDRDSLVTERDSLVTERDRLVTERDSLVTERDRLVTERDGLVTEREKLVTERDDLIAELDRKVSECNAIIHGKESELTILSQKIEAGICEKKVFSDEVDRLNSSLLENKEKVAILHERISSLQELLQKATATHDAKLTAVEEERQKLLDALLEAQGNSKSAADVDSEKFFKLKDELKRSKESCQILQKEMTAVREARALQVQEMSDLRAQLYKLQQASSSKDEEIISLQNEVKKALASHVMPSTAVVASPAPAKIKQEPSCEEMLKEQLRAKDVVVCDLLAQLSLARDQSADTTTAASVSSPPACETPFLAPPSSSAHKVTKVATRSESDSSFASTPAASEKKKRGRPKTLQVPCLQEATSLSSSTRRSTRRTRACVAFTAMDTDDNASDTEEESPAGSYSSSRRGRRGTASNRRTTHTKKPRERLVNPHLESNKENRISMANKYESVSEALDAAKSMPKSTRGRRRRQLYEEDVDQPLYCSPQLIEPMPPVDSPHTAVRRHLKAQPK